MTSLMTSKVPLVNALLSTPLQVHLWFTCWASVRINLLFMFLHLMCSGVQPTARAPFLLLKGSCWLSWRRIKEMDGWESSEAVERRATYQHHMSDSHLSLVPSQSFFLQGQRSSGEHKGMGDDCSCPQPVFHRFQRWLQWNEYEWVLFTYIAVYYTPDLCYLWHEMLPQYADYQPGVVLMSLSAFKT